jgi:hypothetical protein
MHKLILVLILTLTLIGCSENIDIVSYPQNIRYQEETVLWDAVDGTSSYTIKVNDETYEVTTPSFSIEGLPNGTYDIRIRSQKDDNLSYYSPVLNIIINRTYDTFEYVSLIEDMLAWPEIPGVSSYEIYHGSQLLTTTPYNSVDLSTLDLFVNQLYLLHVIARYPSQDIVYSDSIIYHTYVDLNIHIETTFDHNHIENLFFNLDEQFPIHDVLYGQNLIASNLYHYEENTLILEHDAFHPNSEGIHEIHILTPAGFIKVSITVINEANPELLSEDTINYQDENMSFTFDLHGGTFVGLSGNDITSDDYTFDGETLTVNASYIEALLQENPLRQTVILVYQLSKNNNVSMGFIFINISQ